MQFYPARQHINFHFLLIFFFSYAKTFLGKKKKLEISGLFFSFPLPQVVAGRADGDICSTSKERDVFTSPTHVSLKQPKSLLCKSYFSPAEGELTLIKIPQLATVVKYKISS